MKYFWKFPIFTPPKPSPSSLQLSPSYMQIPCSTRAHCQILSRNKMQSRVIKLGRRVERKICAWAGGQVARFPRAYMLLSILCNGLLLRIHIYTCAVYVYDFPITSPACLHLEAHCRSIKDYNCRLVDACACVRYLEVCAPMDTY